MEINANQRPILTSKQIKIRFNSVNKVNNNHRLQDALYKFMGTLAGGMNLIGEGMAKQYNEDLRVKKRP